jgi:hypothetical protein
MNNSVYLFKEVAIDSKLIDSEYQLHIEEAKEVLRGIRELEEQRLAMHGFVDKELRGK